MESLEQKKVHHGRATDAIELVLSNLANKIEKDRKYAVLLNNLGGCTPLEMAIVAGEIEKSELSPKFSYLYGPALLMTSLNMQGFSISILKLTQELEEALLFPVSGEVWPQAKKLESPEILAVPQALENTAWIASEQQEVRNLVLKCCDVLEQQEKFLNELDAKIGDGDTGSSLANAARSLKKSYR